MRRSLLVLVMLLAGCGRKSSSGPSPAGSSSNDPFNPVTECKNYVARAEPSLAEALSQANNNDMTKAQPLRDRASAMGRARGALGTEPFVTQANGHYKRALRALDGLASALSTLAASREPDAPANPELQLIALRALKYRKELDDVVKELPTLCAAVK